MQRQMQRKFQSVALVVFASGISTCGGSGGSVGMGFPPGSGATFEVVGSIPSAGASGVGLGTQIQVRFEHPVNPVTVTPASFAVWTTERVPGDIQVAGDTVLFQAQDPLAVSAAHSVRLSGAIRSTAGESLSTDVEIPFHTRDGNWGVARALPSDATLADLTGTPTGELLALRMRASSPWSDLVVTRLTPPGTAWLEDTQLFGDGSVAFARMAVDEQGWGVAVANRSLGGNTYAIQAVERAPDGSWGAPVEAAPLDSGFTQPQLAIVSAGRALLAWRRNATGEVWGRTLDAASGWSPARRLSAEGESADAPVVAADGQGAALVVWREASRRLHTARFSDPLGWDQPGAPVGELVHDSFTCCVSEPVAALAPGVAPLVAWHADGTLFASRFQPQTSTWSGAQVVNGAGCAGVLERPCLAVDSTERAFATWLCDGNLWTAWSEPGEAWGEPAALDVSGSVSDPLLSLDANGNATVLWTRRPVPTDTRRLLARRHSSLGIWGNEVQLSDAGFCAVAPRLVRLPGGVLHAAWTVTVGCDFTQGTGSRAAPFE